MKLLIRLFFLMTLAAVAAGCTDPLTTINATDLRGQALDDRVISLEDDDDFVKTLNSAQVAFESGFLQVKTTKDANGNTVIEGVQAYPITPDALKAYTSGRFTQVNDLCKIYFDGLFKTARTQDFAKSSISLAANAAAGVLGLTSAAATQLAFLALGEEAVLQSFDSFEEIYFLSPSPQNVYELVIKSQQSFLTRNQTELANLAHYHDARDLVRQYATLCTPESIRRLIDAKIASGELQTENRQPGGLSGTAERAGLRMIGADMGISTLTLDQAANIYIAMGRAGATTDQENTAKTTLGDLWTNLSAGQKSSFSEFMSVDLIKAVRAIKSKAQEILTGTPAPAAAGAGGTPPVDQPTPTPQSITEPVGSG